MKLVPPPFDNIPPGSEFFDVEGLPVARIPTPGGGYFCVDYGGHQPQNFNCEQVSRNGSSPLPFSVFKDIVAEARDGIYDRVPSDREPTAMAKELRRAAQFARQAGMESV